MGRVLCECGAILLDDVTTTGVVPVGAADEIPFRRTTDHVVCPSCFRTYPVTMFQPEPEDEDDVIGRLERLAEEGRSAE